MGIKRITVINPISNRRLNFYDKMTFQQLHKCVSPYDYLKVALDFGDFMRINNLESGFYGLPFNNNNTQNGIGQNGFTFLDNYYNGRMLLWTFQTFAPVINLIDTVLYQNDYLLNLEVETENGIFNTTGTVNGTYETGGIEFQCDKSFFYKENSTTVLEDVIPLVVLDVPLIPSNGFYVNSVYFASQKDKHIVDVNIPIERETLIEVSGQWNNLEITNLTTGANLNINAICFDKLVIDGVKMTAFLDGIEVTSQMSGEYPYLASGLNQFYFDFGEQYTDVSVKFEYQEVFASVF